MLFQVVLPVIPPRSNRKKSIPLEIENVALLGWHVYPMSPRSKAGCFKGAHDAATCDLDVIERWCRDYLGCNWRVVMGPSRLFALDVDRAGQTHKADGFAALQKLVRKHGPLPPRPMTKTGGSGGAVLFFRHQGELLRGASGCPAPGLDPHRIGQAIVIPPSRHPMTKGAYHWRKGCAPWEIAPPPLPSWLADLLRPPPEPVRDYGKNPFYVTNERAFQVLMRAVYSVETAPSGGSNDTLNKQAYRVGRWCGAGVLSEHDAIDCLLVASKSRGIPYREARDTIRSGLRGGMRHPHQERTA
nr:bifunctional DNA primase/polymerase [Saccharibacter floricola]